MRYVRLVFIFLAVAAALVAADPFVGTWKVNPAKSKFKTGAAPKEQTVTIAESGGNLDIAVKGTAVDGTPISTRYTCGRRERQGHRITLRGGFGQAHERQRARDQLFQRW
jgi:hypothetical protein